MLPDIARVLVPLLQIWLYASQRSGLFEKRYDEVCQLLGLRQYDHLSKITEKLGPALDELGDQVTYRRGASTARPMAAHSSWSFSMGARSSRSPPRTRRALRRHRQPPAPREDSSRKTC